MDHADYTPEALARAAEVDPWALALQVTAARPDSVRMVGQTYGQRAEQAAGVVGLARTADTSTANSYFTDGVPVFDSAESGRQSRHWLSDDGDAIAETGAVFIHVAQGLAEAGATVEGHLRTIRDDINDVIARRNRFMRDAGRNLLPEDREAAELGFHAEAIAAVQRGAPRVRAELDSFDDLLRSRTARLVELTGPADQPPAAGASPTTGTEPPGQPGGAPYVLGSPTSPPINYTDGFAYGSAGDPTVGDYVAWNKWGLMLRGGTALRPDLDDATELYAHYRDNTGTPMIVDYEEGYREDPAIRRAVDDEIARARQSIEQIHGATGATSFSVSGDRNGVPYPETENWQKTLGDHTTWGSGEVTIVGNRATAVVTVHADDTYDFNPGATDIATAAPDDENGRFEELGWARPFETSGNVPRTVTWELGSDAPPVIAENGPARQPAGEDRADERGSSRQDGPVQRGPIP